MSEFQRPSIGRIVHFVCRNQAGDVVHRPAIIGEVCGQIPPDTRHVVNVNVFIAPGDQLPGMYIMSPTSNLVASVPLLWVGNVVYHCAGAAAGEPFEMTWHWPERVE